jgi:hypothetical protein
MIIPLLFVAMTNRKITATIFEFRALAIAYRVRVTCSFFQATLAAPINITYSSLRFKDEV